MEELSLRQSRANDRSLILLTLCLYIAERICLHGPVLVVVRADSSAEWRFDDAMAMDAMHMLGNLHKDQEGLFSSDSIEEARDISGGGGGGLKGNLWGGHVP